jgi:phage regulator Rha-like protein
MIADGLSLKKVLKTKRFKNAFGVMKGKNVKKWGLYDVIITETEEAFYIKVEMPINILLPIHKWELAENFQVANLTIADLLAYIYKLNFSLRGGLRRFEKFQQLIRIHEGIVNAKEIREMNENPKPLVFKSGQNLNQTVYAFENEPVTHSILFAKAFNKRHYDVLRSINFFISEWGYVGEFISYEYLDLNGLSRPGFLINEFGFDALVTESLKKKAPEMIKHFSDEFSTGKIKIYSSSFFPIESKKLLQTSKN